MGVTERLLEMDRSSSGLALVYERVGSQLIGRSFGEAEWDPAHLG